MEEKQLAVVEQLPLIRQYFEDIRKDVADKTAKAMSLVVTEENIKDIKKIRAELNKEFQGYEEKRKEIKKQILAPYELFEKEYKESIADAFIAVDSTLKNKIVDSEDIVRLEKQNELKEYFDELAESLHLTQYVNFEKFGIKVNLSDSMKKLTKQVEEKLTSIQNDIMLINLENDKTEILVEYLIDYNFARAKMAVWERKEAAMRFQEEQEKTQKIIQEEQERVAQIEKQIIIPKIEQPNKDLLTTSFRVQGTKEQLIALREYINESGLTLLKD